MRALVLNVERPDSEATVGFLSEGVSVLVRICNGKIEVHAKAFHDEDGYTWDEHDVEWPMPKKEGA